MTIGKRITLARQARCITKMQLAKRMEVSYQTICDWEEDNITPRPTRFEKLAQALKVPTDWLILGQGDFSPANSSVGVYSITALEEEIALSYGVQTYDDNVTVRRVDIHRDLLGKDDDGVLSILTMQGTSMSPTIKDGDALLINRSDSEIQDGLIFAAVINGDIFVNRFCWRPDGKFVMVFDNTSYPSYTIQEGDQIKIIGRVIMSLTANRH